MKFDYPYKIITVRLISKEVQSLISEEARLVAVILEVIILPALYKNTTLIMQSAVRKTKQLESRW